MFDKMMVVQYFGNYETENIFNQIDAWIAADDHFPCITGKEGKTYKLSEVENENILKIRPDNFLQACQDVEALQKLTDEWLNQSIRNSSDPGLEKARQILKRIDDRDKYK